MELRNKLVAPVKGTPTITKYKLDIQSAMDSLALMNKPVDFDELFIRFLRGLDESYTYFAKAIEVRETPIEFDELFEELINLEEQLKALEKHISPAPATALAAPLSSGTTLSGSNSNRSNN